MGPYLVAFPRFSELRLLPTFQFYFNSCLVAGTRGSAWVWSGAALVDVCLDVVPLPLRSSSQTVAGCRLGRYPAGRDRWGGERVVGGVLPRINIGAAV